ncbi:MAG: 2-hydroxyglutaryl-CoA dehydratase [Candidatus Lokiarchaeota archaeon]|nr:2-hydroxyglutaryl-CoA dehydratase [Candidatus Lokiarchaeota archaeon]
MADYVGIDIGSLTGKAVIISEDEEIKTYKIIGVKKLPIRTVKALLDIVLPQVNITDIDDVTYCVGTGYGRRKIPLANETMSEITCHGIGAHHVVPTLRTVIDIGGQDCKVIRLDEKGNLKNFIMNEKCAAGTGRYLELMSETLNIKLEELGPISLKSKSPISIQSKCSLYAQFEVISLLGEGYKKPDLAAGINKAMAERVINLANKVGIELDVAVSGGVAKNIGVVKNMEEILGIEFKELPVDPQIIGALGAALIAKKAHIKSNS